MIKLDDRDIKILSVLDREGRISKTELAKRVSLSATPCWERLQRLEKAGIISAYRAEISLKKIAAHVEVFVMAELENHRVETMQGFERAVERYDEIVNCWALGGGYDYVLHVVCSDIDTYQRMIDQLLGEGAGFARYFTYVVTKPVKSGRIPFEALLPPRGKG